MMQSWRQRTPMSGAALLLLSAAIVALVVIPFVHADTYPGAAPDRAALAFWANVLLTLLAAAAAFGSWRFGSNRAGLRRVLAGVAGFLALCLGLLLVDAALAFVGHGSGMRGAVVALWVCVCLDVIAGAGMLWTAFARQD